MFGCLQDSALSVIEVEQPHCCTPTCGAHEPSSLQHRTHALRRVNKCPKRVAFQPPPEVLERSQGSHIPKIAGVGEGDQSARSRGYAAKQRLCIRVAADYALKRHDVGIS